MGCPFPADRSRTWASAKFGPRLQVKGGQPEFDGFGAQLVARRVGLFVTLTRLLRAGSKGAEQEQYDGKCSGERCAFHQEGRTTSCALCHW